MQAFTHAQACMSNQVSLQPMKVGVDFNLKLKLDQRGEVNLHIRQQTQYQIGKNPPKKQNNKKLTLPAKLRGS